jgi:hypothetical protein
MADLAPLASLGDARRFEFHDATKVGADMRLLARARHPGRQGTL